MLTLDTVYKATTVLADVVRHTSLIHTDKINPLCDVYLKPENLQVTGSFKVRGAVSKYLSFRRKKNNAASSLVLPAITRRA